MKQVIQKHCQEYAPSPSKLGLMLELFLALTAQSLLLIKGIYEYLCYSTMQQLCMEADKAASITTIERQGQYLQV